ncbi:hypothetical protein Ahy_B05g074233 [Arachis hypogaea]|uniref:Endonuclease/exonuclease/phosphatase domain-containing protein n=1 Tax=Arachis hypogaea TaxID=3818 RepID=A0A444YYD7_ARAHY|nr:hypothetical protein Ahy_B05g074233 [Arachis hypogaea]
MELVVRDYMKRMEREKWEAFNSSKNARMSLDHHVVRENMLFNFETNHYSTGDRSGIGDPRSNQVKKSDVFTIEAGSRDSKEEAWNCKGAASKAFPSIIRDLRQEYKANFFILLETHVSGTRGKQIRDKMGFDKSCVVDAIGHSGGWPFTWKRGNLAERLDRGLSNLEWQIAFPEAYVKHLSMFNSDHSPICLQLSNAVTQNRRRRPFRFLAAWITHPDFGNFGDAAWNVKNS